MTRAVWMGCGFSALGLGILGVWLPLLPTTPFVLLAAYCFSHGSPQWERWLLNHPLFGPPLRDWREARVIRRRSKVLALATLGGSAALLGFLDVVWWGKGAAWAIMGVVAVYIATRRSAAGS